MTTQFVFHDSFVTTHDSRAPRQAMDWTKGEAIWKQIERALRDDIARGLYKPGEKLPTENELAKRFDVNRHTIRRAISALSEANVTFVEQGRGIFVREQMLDYPLGNRPRFTQIVSSRHRLPDKILLKSETLKANRVVAKNLALSLGTPVIRLECVSSVDSTPLAHAIHYLPATRFHGLAELFAQKHSLTDCFHSYQITDYTRKFTRITAKMPGAKVAQHLKQPSNRPLLVTENVDIDAGGQPIEYGITSFCGHRVQLLVDQGQHPAKVG